MDSCDSDLFGVERLASLDSADCDVLGEDRVVFRLSVLLFSMLVLRGRGGSDCVRVG